MDVDRDWRARQAAELIGTPFERPQGNTDDRTLPFSGHGAGVPAEPAGQIAGPGASAPRFGGTQFLFPRKAASRLIYAVAAGLALAAAIWLFVAGQTVVDRQASATIAAAPNYPVVKPMLVPDRPPEGEIASTGPSSAMEIPTVAALPSLDKPSSAQREQAPRANQQRPRATAKPRPAKRDQPVRAAAATVAMPVRRCVPTNMPVRDLICTTPVLAEGDRREQRLYGQLLASGDARYALRAQKSHSNFVKRRDRCKDVACIVTAHRKQSEVFDRWIIKIAEKQARASERALPICKNSQVPQPNVCRKSRKFSLRRFFGS